MAGLAREQRLDLAERGSGVSLAHQHGCVVVPRHVEARREFQAALEQLLGVLVTAQPCSDFRQHAQRGDVGRVSLQVGAQPRVRHRQVVGHQRGCGLQQVRIAARRLQVARPRQVRTARVATDIELVREQTPAIRGFGLQLQRAAKRGDRLDVAARLTERRPELQKHRRGARLLAGERLEDRERRLQLPGETARCPEHQAGARFLWYGAQDFEGLVRRQLRMLLQQPRGMGERRVH